MADRYALVVGIDAYGGGIPTLGSARNDAQAIAASLASQHGYVVRSLLDGEATRDAVMDFLTKEIPSHLSTATPFLVYFAGHGVAEGEDGSKGPQGYLILQDAELGKPETWLSMDAFREALPAACRHLLVVLDCCYAGAFRWATATRDIGLVKRPLYQSQYQRWLDSEAWQALTSASAAQRAADDAEGLPNLRGIDDQGHSPFAAALIDGLAGGADTSTAQFPADGVITAPELYQYVATCLQPAPDAPEVQTPGIWPLKPDNDGEFFFFNPKVKLKTEPDPPLDDSNNPWLGLEAYTAATRDLFFGRQDEIDALVARVTARRTGGALLAVVGSSGSGKTSLVQAGLVPALDPSKWAIVQAGRLTGDPSAVLHAAVEELEAPPKRRRRMLVLDQFEDLYTQCPDGEARGRFLGELRDLVNGKGGPAVVVTLRSDFELRAEGEPSLHGLWQAAQYQVPPFTGDDLRRVILGPPQVKAVYFDPASIADELFDEVVQTPGALPLLSFALADLYRQGQERRRKTGAADRAITTADYDAIGGVVGALNRRATEIYETATHDEQQAIRRVFLRLVSHEGAGLTRREATRAELQFGDGDDAEQQCVDRVIQRYVEAGLLVIDGDSVEPAHDALVAQWQLLHDWLKASDTQDLIRAAWAASSAWEAHGRLAGYLWSGDPRLPQLTAARVAGDLNATERAFEAASTSRRKARKRRLVASVAAVIAVLAAATLIALLQRAQAISERNAAASLALAATADSEREGDLGTSLLLGLEASRLGSSSQARVSMAATLEEARSSGAQAILPTDQGNIAAVAFSPNGDMLAAGGSNGTVTLWNARGGRVLGPSVTLTPPSGVGSGGPIDAVAFSHTGRTLAAGTTGGDVFRWNTHTHRPLSTLNASANTGSSTSLAFDSRDMLAAGAGFGGVQLWKGGAQVPPRGPGPAPGFDRDETLPSRGSVASVAFSADGRSLVAATSTETRLWHLRSGASEILKAGASSSVAWSPDGDTLAIGYPDGTVQLWNARKHRLGPLLPGRQGRIDGLAFSPDNRTLAGGTIDGQVLLWDVRKHRQIGELAGHEGAVWSVAFSRGGHTLAAGTSAGAVVVYDVPTDASSVTSLSVRRSPGQSAQAVFSPDGSLLAARTYDVRSSVGDIALWDAPWPYRLTKRSFDVDNVKAIAFNPHGSVLAAATSTSRLGDGEVLLWRLRAGRPVGKPRHLELTPSDQGSCGGCPLLSVAFSPDGRTVAATYDGGNIYGSVLLWTTRDGRRVGLPLYYPQAGKSPRMTSVAFDPTGTMLVAISNGAVVTWAFAAGRASTRTTLELPGHSYATSVAFSPDGQTLAVGTANGTVVLWDVAGQRPVTRTLDAGSPVTHVAFDPHGQSIAASTTSGTVLEWDLGSDVLTGTLSLDGAANSVSVSPVGSDVAIGTSDGEVKIWTSPTWRSVSELELEVCALVHGNLTPAEWNERVHGIAYRKICPG